MTAAATRDPALRRAAILRWFDRFVNPALLMVAAATIPLLIVATGDPSDGDRRIIEVANWVVWALFTVNFVVRVTLAANRRREVRSLLLDLIIIVGQPLLAVAGGVLGSATALVRVVVVLGRAVATGSVARRSWRKLKEAPLRMLAAILPLLWLTSAALILRLEQKAGTITSIGDGLWWSAVTMTTVGYGDLSPTTAGGRCVAVGTMVVGIGMFSIVTAKLAEVLLIQRTLGARGDVLEDGHTLILGWSPKVYAIIEQLMIANENSRQGSVVVLANVDKVEMTREIELRLPDLRRSPLTVTCRSGSPTDPAVIDQAAPHRARSVIVLDDPATDAGVVKSLLALFNGDRQPGAIPVVAEVLDPGLAASLTAVFGDRVAIVDPMGFIARTAAQSCRIPGVALAYEQLLGFKGSEFYIRAEPAGVGLCFDELRNAYSDCCVIGIVRADGTVELNPPASTAVSEGDSLVVIAEDDQSMTWVGPSVYAAPVAHAPVVDTAPPAPEDVWVFGWNDLGARVLVDLDQYMPPGSHITVAVTPELEPLTTGVPTGLANATVDVQVAGGPEHAAMVRNCATRCDHALVLCDVTPGTTDSDPRALLTTMELREALRSCGRTVNVVTEVRDERDVDLIPRTTAADFIVSERLASLLLAQVSEHAHLAAVYEDLLHPNGSELYCKPAERYVEPGRDVSFADIVVAAGARHEVAIGYRRTGDGSDPHYGVVTNPRRDHRVTLAAGDQVVVLAESEWSDQDLSRWTPSPAHSSVAGT